MSRLTAAAYERNREPVDSGTAGRILDSAISLFAARGFDEVTVRDIAEHAGANPAAISYYFGAKEQLIQQAIRSVIAPLNVLRLSTLADVRKDAPGDRVALEDVVRAMVEPTVRACIGGTGSERHYARVLALSLALRQPYVNEVMNEQTDEVVQRFVEALGEALPGGERARLYWGYDFMIGAMLHILLDSSRNHRLHRVSGGLCDTSNPNDLIEQLVTFIVGGLRPKQPVP
jgi:AcrR family transcriptional regulator